MLYADSYGSISRITTGHHICNRRDFVGIQLPKELQLATLWGCREVVQSWSSCTNYIRFKPEHYWKQVSDDIKIDHDCFLPDLDISDIVQDPGIVPESFDIEKYEYIHIADLQTICMVSKLKNAPLMQRIMLEKLNTVEFIYKGFEKYNGYECAWQTWYYCELELGCVEPHYVHKWMVIWNSACQHGVLYLLNPW